MSKTNSVLNNIDYHKVAKNLATVFIHPFIEVYEGINKKNLPVFKCLFVGVILNFLVITGLDLWLFDLLGLLILYPENLFNYYKILCVFAPFWGWGFFQVILKIKLVKKLTETFINSGLRSVTGKLPSFIFDKPIDEFTRIMRLARNGLSQSQFLNAKENLESSLQIFIDEIKEIRTNGTIDITYSQTKLSDFFPIKNFGDIKKDSYLLGKGRAKNLYGKFEDTPHLLVAGQTGGGKSTFLRQLITSLYIKNKDYSFELIDLKEGLEFQIFDNLPRVNVQSQVPASIAILKKLADVTIKERAELLKLNGCENIGAFLKIPKEDRKYTKTTSKNTRFNRHIVVVDEAFDLFMKGAYADAKAAQNSRRYSSKIAAQGRAVGIHIVIATQRPDKFAVDTQTKSNLTGKIAFRASDIASSSTVLDSKRASELPNIKGRAIWKNSSRMHEIQTPFFSKEQAIEMLEGYYIKEKEPQKQEEETKEEDKNLKPEQDSNIEDSK